MKIFFTLAILGVVFAEKSGPYPPRGWKPEGQALQLPSREYGAPQDPNRVEITTTSNQYIPPAASQRSAADDFLQVQALPAANSFSQFNQQQNQENLGFSQFNQQNQENSAEFVGNSFSHFNQQQNQERSSGSDRPFLLSPSFAPQFRSQEQLREQKFENSANDGNFFNVNFGGNGENFFV